MSHHEYEAALAAVHEHEENALAEFRAKLRALTDEFRSGPQSVVLREAVGAVRRAAGFDYEDSTKALAEATRRLFASSQSGPVA